MDRVFMFLSAVLGFTGVAAGAFGSHVLRTRLVPDLVSVFETGVRYQMYHALALFMVALSCGSRPAHPLLNIAGWCFFGGTLVFSGSLYVLSLTGVRWLGAITPLGGLGFLTGWLLLGIVALRTAY